MKVGHSVTIATCAIPMWWVRPLATGWTGSRMEPPMSPRRAAWWHWSPPSPDWAAPDGVTGLNGGVDLQFVCMQSAHAHPGFADGACFVIGRHSLVQAGRQLFKYMANVP